MSRAMAQAISILPLVAEAHVQTSDSLRGIFGGRNGTGSGLSFEYFAFSCPSHYLPHQSS